MNSTLDLIEQRRSVRSYSAEVITQAEKDAILHATLRAPTAGAMMLYTVIEVEDQALKDRLAETCDHQPFIARAPWVLLFLADYQRWMDYYEYCGTQERCNELGIPFRTPGPGDLMLACCDALIAAQTAVIAAESLGIGSCYIGDILEQYETHRDLFKLPPWTLPVTLLCFGRPASPSTQRVGRFDRRFIVHQNAYHGLEGEEFEEMMQIYDSHYTSGKASYIAGARNFGQHNYLRKFSAEFSIEMNRSVKEMLKNWKG